MNVLLSVLFDKPALATDLNTINEMCLVRKFKWANSIDGYFHKMTVVHMCCLGIKFKSDFF